MSKKKQKEPEKEQKSLYLTVDLWNKIQKKADIQRRSVNNYLEILIEKEVA